MLFADDINIAITSEAIKTFALLVLTPVIGGVTGILVWIGRLIMSSRAEHREDVLARSATGESAVAAITKGAVVLEELRKDVTELRHAVESGSRQTNNSPRG